MRTRPLLLPAVLLLLLGVTPGRAEDGHAHLVARDLTPREDGTCLYRFGQASQEEELDATFRLANDGDATLTGLKAVGDCGCYGVELSTSTLEPGAVAEARVKFRTLMMSGRLTKRLRLYHDDDGGKPLTIRLQVDVVAGVVVEPHRFFFENVLVGSLPEATVVAKWREGVGRPFRVTSVEVPDQDVTVSRTPYAEDGWKGTAITLRFETPPPLGVLSGTALIGTDHPDYPRITLALTANVTGRVWVQSRVAYLGWVPKGSPRQASLLVRPFDDSVELGAVTASSRHGRVDVRVERAPPGPDQGWRVHIAVPADAPLGQIDDVVEIHTDVEGEEITEIEVRGEVIEHGE